MLHPQLAEMVARGKVSHSWLLTGRENSLLEQANALAAALLCPNSLARGEACGTCWSCKKTQAGNHPDLQVIKPEGLSVKIHQTRKMQHYANLESYEGGRQVIIIHGAHTMQVAAANSLLKILEEPPLGVYFILTAPVGDHLLPTILSRVVWVRLNEALGEAAPLVYKEDLLQADLILEMQAKAFKCLTILKGDAGSLLLFANTFKEDKTRSISIRKQVDCFLQQLLLLLRDIAVTELAKGGTLLSAKTPPLVLSKTNSLKAAILVEEYLDLLGKNMNTTLLLNVLFLKLQDLAKKQV